MRNGRRGGSCQLLAFSYQLKFWLLQPTRRGASLMASSHSSDPRPLTPVPRPLILLILLVLLTACADVTPTPVAPNVTPTPPLATATLLTTSPALSPTATTAATLSPTLPANTPTISIEPPPTVALPTPVPATATPSLPPIPPTATATPVIAATATAQPTTNPVTPTPAITPGNQVPVLPVRRTGGTLTVGVLDSDFKNRNFSPYTPDLSDISLHLQRLVWNARLLYRDPVRLDWKPLAALGMPQLDNEGRKFTFTLREDLRWSDGSSITSADYIFAFNNALLPENKFPRMTELRRINVTGPDLRTLVFTFDDRYATALQTLSLIEPLPAKVWSRYPFAAPDRNPEIIRPTVVSGPYRPDQSGLSFSPVLGFTAGRPNLDRINLKLLANMDELYDSLRTGVINWTFHALPGGWLNQFRENNSVSVYRWTPLDSGRRYIGYNLDNSFLQSKAVRQALNRVLDVRSLIAAVENGLASEQIGFLPVSNEYALKGANPGRFSVRATRDGLATLGYSQREPGDKLNDPFGRPVLSLELIYPDRSPEAEAIAVYLRQQYQQLGLNVNLNKLDSATYQKRRSEGQYDLEIGLSLQSGAADADDFKSQLVSRGGQNFGGYSNPQVDSLFAEGLRLASDSDAFRRRQVYERLQQLVVDDAPYFFLYTLQAYTVMSNNVDPGGAGMLNLPRWMLAWDAFPAYLNWYSKDAP